MKTTRMTAMKPCAIENIAFNKGFWDRRREINRRVSIPAEYRALKKTGRIDAFKLDWKPGKKGPPHEFWDSDVAKWIEAAAYSLVNHPDKTLERKIDGIVNLMAKAQQPDGYLNVHYIVTGKPRWSDLAYKHELYCAGHLIEAAIAYRQVTGKRLFLDIMCKYADLICRVFGPKGKKGYPGHEEIELAMVRLYRETGERRYLDQAKRFVDLRGISPRYFELESRKLKRTQALSPDERWKQIQAHRPVREQLTAEGHAVRAGYLYSAMTDVAQETGDRDLLAACKKLWRNIVRKRMYVTGGVGSAHRGERFTFDYDLPNEEAYCETCAGIALVMFAHRMLQLERDSEYADIMELALYNNVLGGVSEDGMKFLYANALYNHPDVSQYNSTASATTWTIERQEWFGCACCPPNLSRLLASLGKYACSCDRSGIWIHLYDSFQTCMDTGKGLIKLKQDTRYPWNGKVRIRIGAQKETAMSLRLRIPSWCRKASIKLNGKQIHPPTRKGYAILKRKWTNRDRIEIDMAMPVERIEAHPNVRTNSGRTAIKRGPLVYCFEETDNGKNLHDLVLPRGSDLKMSSSPDLTHGSVVLTGNALRRDVKVWKNQLYSSAKTPTEHLSVTAIPYFQRANRKPGEMLVWIRE